MVYNVGGGNKSKGLARKFVVQSHAGNSKTVRIVQESGEQYAIVQKHLGNCMCLVYCSDGYRRLCIIRKKFTGRRKTDNNISSGSVVLIGLHDYSSSSSNTGESESGKDIKRCDLLYVYSDQEKEKLRKLCDLSKLSSSLEDSGPKNANVAAVAEHESDDIMFITSGTGVFNKYAKDESRHKGLKGLTDPISTNNNSGSKNVISNRAWLDNMNMPSDDDDDNDDDNDNDDDDNDDDNHNDDVDEKDEGEDEGEDECEDEPYAKKSAATKKDIIDIDDI